MSEQEFNELVNHIKSATEHIGRLGASTGELHTALSPACPHCGKPVLDLANCGGITRGGQQDYYHMECVKFAKPLPREQVR